MGRSSKFSSFFDVGLGIVVPVVVESILVLYQTIALKFIQREACFAEIVEQCFLAFIM